MKKDPNMSVKLTFDNELGWACVWKTIEFALFQTLVLAIGLVVIDLFFYFVGGVPLANHARTEAWFVGTFPIYLFAINAVKYAQRLRTGQYSIIGNNP